MDSERLDDLPLFLLPIVLLPTEVLPLHIFEDRYKTMIELCMTEGTEFGVIWLSDEGLKEVGCTASVTEILERTDDGRMNILVQGSSPFRLLERREEHIFPAGDVELLGDRSEGSDQRVSTDAHETYATLVERVTDERPEEEALEQLGAYEMAATVDIGPEVKQGLLELRSERARLRLLSRLFKAAMKRLDVADKIAEQARTNGKVQFDSSGEPGPSDPTSED
jgi:Lon protease-like protein